MLETNWINLKKEKPHHKDLTLYKMKDGTTIPAIFYDNDDFNGFYPFATYCTNTNKDSFSSKEETKVKFKNIIKWMLIPE